MILMNKKIILFVTLIITICLFTTSCKKEDKKDEVKELKNVPKEIDLKANQSSGYTWTYELSNVEENAELKPEDIVEVSDKYIEKCPEEKQTDCPGIDTFTIKGLKPGQVKIEFKYQFITKKKTKTAKTAIYIIEVDDKLNVLEKSHEGNYFEEE